MKKKVGLGDLYGMSFAAIIQYWKPRILTMKRLTLSLLFAAVLPGWASAQTLDIQLDKPGASIQPTMYGLFIEDINFAADGLFASAVRDGDKVYVKVVNTSEKQQNLVLNFGGKNVKAVTSILFSSDNLYKDNTLDERDLIIPREMAFQGEGSNVDVAVNPLSFPSIFCKFYKKSVF